MNVEVRPWAFRGSFTRVFSLLLGIAAVFAFLNPAEAIEINIRAHSELQVGVSTAGTMVRVRGTLRDRQGNGLSQREITVNFRNLDSTPNRAPLDSEPDASAQIFTERGGVFRVHRELMPGRWGVEVAFKETPNLSGERFTTTVEVREMPVALSLHIPSLIVGTDLALPVRVQATVDGVGLPEDAEVFLDDAPAGAVELDQFGRGTIVLDAPIAGGLHKVRAQLSNPRYSETEPALETLRVSESIDLQAEIQEVLERLRRGLVVRGSVRDPVGELEGVRVSVELFRRGAPLDSKSGQSDSADETKLRPHLSVKTDAAGKFTAFFPSADLADGIWSARVEVTPDAGSRVSAEAEPIQIDHKVSRWVLNLLAVLGLLGGFGLLIQRFWQVIYTYLSDLKRKRASRERADKALEDVEYLELTSLDAALPIDESVAPSKVVLAGVVWDIWKQRPVSQAQIVIRKAGDSEPLRTQQIEPTHPGERARRVGAFRVEDLPRGRYELSLSASGYMPSRLEFRLPHDGKLSNMRLGMVAIPLKIRRLYQSLVESLEGRDLWGTLSLHEIDDALQAVLRESAADDGISEDSLSEGSLSEDGISSDEPPLDSSARRAFVSALKRHLRQGDTMDVDAADPTEDSQLSGERLMALMTAVVEETYFSGRVFDDAVWQLARRLAERIREKAQGGPS